MAVEDLDTIDIEVVGKNDDIRWGILDGLPWGDNEAIGRHLTTQRRKINFYLDCAESDHFKQAHPRTTPEMITIELILRYEPPQGVLDYLEGLRDELAGDPGVVFVYTIDRTS